eukprot:jgi/Galph1/1503/GphlegSOOS_G186.1
MGGIGLQYHVPVKSTVSLGHPEALGLAGFAATDFMLSCINAHLLPSSMTNSIIALGFMYGGFSTINCRCFDFYQTKYVWRSCVFKLWCLLVSIWCVITLEAEYSTKLLSTSDFDEALGFILVCYTISILTCLLLPWHTIFSCILCFLPWNWNLYWMICISLVPLVQYLVEFSVCCVP